MILNEQEEIGDKLKSLDGGLKTINEYLMIEVLANQPENLKHALVKSSITDRFCENLLDEIILEKSGINGQEFILQLKNSNLFITKIDAEGKWYRYHPLFRALLKDQLNELYSQEEVNKYQMQASHWFAINRFSEEFSDDDLVKEDTIIRDKIIENSGGIQKDKLNVLTKKELEVLNCISEGMRNQEIADRLFNSEETIKKHINNMFQKMYVKNRLSLVNRAREVGII
jgi:LuxR family maltose regulon positive regulatory protein